MDDNSALIACNCSRNSFATVLAENAAFTTTRIGFSRLLKSKHRERSKTKKALEGAMVYPVTGNAVAPVGSVEPCAGTGCFR